VCVRLTPERPFSIVPEGPIAWRQDLPERRWFVSQNLNKFLDIYYDDKDE
jgi:hypothetical protein